MSKLLTVIDAYGRKLTYQLISVEVSSDNIKLPKKKYERKCPKDAAKLYSIGFEKMGLDEKTWRVVETKNGEKRWKRIDDDDYFLKKSS